MIKVAQALATFTNNANNDLHKALEDFEKNVIGAFKYTSVCYIGGFPFGKKRREAGVEFEDEEEMEYEDDNDNNEEDNIVNVKVDEEDDHTRDITAVSPNNYFDAKTKSLVYQTIPPTMKPIIKLEKRLEIAGKAEDSEKFRSVKLS